MNRNIEKLWYCHCCTAKNAVADDKCRVCGRPSSYVQSATDRLPLNGNSIRSYRPSQLENILSDVCEVDQLHWTALHHAAIHGNAPLVAELIHLNCEVEAETEQGQTALHLAIFAGSLDSVLALLAAGANINKATNFEKTTPLHVACENGWKSICKLLIEKGANIGAINVMHLTPLHTVAAIGNVDIGILLLRGGAEVSCTDINGRTPLDIAELKDHTLFQYLLLEHKKMKRN
jgi:ankyrin repeat protein